MTINKCSLCFFRIGLNGFDNPMRDQKVIEFKQLIGQVSTLKVQNSLAVVNHNDDCITWKTRMNLNKIKIFNL